MGGGPFNALEHAHGAQGRDSDQTRPARRWRWPLAARRTQWLEELGLPLHAQRRGARNGTRRALKVGLADACKKAAPLRLLLADKVDPLERRRLERSANRVTTARSMTFNEASYVKAHEVGWRHAKHRMQWSSSLTRYVSPVFGSTPVSLIDVAMVMKVLEPIWAKTPETASRIRGRIESILDWAKARGFRQGENPARWRGHLDHLLPARSRYARSSITAPCPTQTWGRS
jgi:hypothetical protein